MRATSAWTRRSTRRTSSADGSRLGGEQLELAADHGQGRAQLVRGIGDERALARERIRQAVEHVVEGVGEHVHLIALTAVVMDPRVQVAGVHARGHGGHAAERARHAGADQIGPEQGAQEREHAGEDERARHAPLGVCDRRQRLAHPDSHGRSAGHADHPLEQPQVADVGKRKGVVAVARRQQVRRQAVLVRLLGARLAILRGHRAEQLGTVGCRSRPWDDGEQQRRARAEWLVANVAPGGLRHARGRVPVDEGHVVRELAGIGGDLAIYLLAQLRPRAVVDRHERDPAAEERDRRHPSRQSPAQPHAGQALEGVSHLQPGLPRR